MTRLNQQSQQSKQIPIIITIMKPPQNHAPKQKQQSSQSFLNKFKGKHSVISKEGLLKLFQSKRKSLQTSINHVQQFRSEKEKVKERKDKKAVEMSNVQNVKPKSERKHSDNYSSLVARKAQLDQLNNKLPPIHKSVSTTLNLRKKQQTPNPRHIQTDNLPKISKKPQKQQKQSKNPPRYSFELDRFALDHLNFLDKFQERLKKREVISH